ncbi:hypothetical protein OG21DRAFT_920171 [Imleria badia]|nr:hypothetical protein OG21DRAFT_920171 [Imleria badia]
MHHALQIQEIILNIFGYCSLPGFSWERHTDLPALARTCHAFKEPALNLLWEKLADPSPLAQCVPDASYRSREDKSYSFTRPLTRTEWGILRSYTRRIRFMLDNKSTLNWESVSTFLNPPTTEPLFPSLRHLHATESTRNKIKHLWYMPFPSLISLYIEFRKENRDVLQGPLESFSKFSPNIKSLTIHKYQPDITFILFLSCYICQWGDLHTVDCDNIALDADALAHLSRMPALTRLHCMPSATLPPSSSPLFFSNLRHSKLSSEFLGSISQLLSCIRLPAITNFIAYVDSRPSKKDFSSFLASVQTSVTGHTIQELEFEDGYLEDAERDMPVLGSEDLQPYMAFKNLRSLLVLDLSWDVDLTDGEILSLASAWPHLEYLLINKTWGWALGGITPDGLLQLLQICPSLMEIALAMDVQDYTEFRESPASLGLTLPPTFSMDVLDSLIEEESVPAVAAFLAVIARSTRFSFNVEQEGLRGGKIHHLERWFDAYEQAFRFSR